MREIRYLFEIFQVQIIQTNKNIFQGLQGMSTARGCQNVQTVIAFTTSTDKFTLDYFLAPGQFSMATIANSEGCDLYIADHRLKMWTRISGNIGLYWAQTPAKSSQS